MENLAYQQYGSGPPLVILHGIFGTGDNWTTFAKHMATNYTVYAIDQRNHGRSFHAEIFDYQTLANDLSDFLAFHQLGDVALLGHSMGGKVAMLFAHQFPHLVNKLVIVDIAPKQNQMEEHRKLLQSLLNLDLSLYNTRTEVENALQSNIPDFNTRQFLMKGIFRQNDGFAWRMNLPALYRNLKEVGADLPLNNPYMGPCLFVKGEKSNYILQADEMRIKQCFPLAKITNIPHAGHWVHAENPSAFAQVVGEFLNQNHA